MGYTGLEETTLGTGNPQLSSVPHQVPVEVPGHNYTSARY